MEKKMVRYTLALELGDRAWTALKVENDYPKTTSVAYSTIYQRGAVAVHRNRHPSLTHETPSVWCEECGFHGPVDQHKEACDS